MKFENISLEVKLILAFAALKLGLHFFTNTNYELHRDAFLYLALGDHLNFGYMAVPPMIAVLARINELLFGTSTFAVRLLPAVIGAVSVGLIGKLVKDLGGKTWAIIIACSAFIFSPAFLRSNTLFQPVSFNQFFWLLLSYFVIKLVVTRDLKNWIYIGIIIGLGFLTKYSILFLVVAYFTAITVSPYRKLILAKEFLLAVLITLIIMSPNLVWQALHNWPVVYHMAELQETQLVNVSLSGFIGMQFLMNSHAVVIWFWALAFLLFSKSGKPYRFVGQTFLFVILLLLILRGKPYYTLGIYTTLFAFGGLAIEEALAARLQFLKSVILACMLFIAMALMPFSLPVLSPERMIAYGKQASAFGAEGALRWEDGLLHDLPQDFADMQGWEELSQIVIDTYLELEPEVKKHTVIYGENYGQAGAIKHFGKKHGLPEPVSFSGSFMFWAPDSAKFTTLVYVNNDVSEIEYYFEDVKMVGKITNRYARESGMPVWLCTKPRNGFQKFYSEKVKRIKGCFTNEALLSKNISCANGDKMKAL